MEVFFSKVTRWNSTKKDSVTDYFLQTLWNYCDSFSLEQLQANVSVSFRPLQDFPSIFKAISVFNHLYFDIFSCAVLQRNIYLAHEISKDLLKALTEVKYLSRKKVGTSILIKSYGNVSEVGLQGRDFP